MRIERTWLALLFFAAVLLVINSAQLVNADQDMCAPAQESSLQKLDKAFDPKIDRLLKLINFLQDKSLDPQSYPVVTTDGRVEIIDLVGTNTKLISLKATAVKQIEEATRDCHVNSAGPEKIRSLAEFYSGSELASVLPPNLALVDASQIMGGTPLGGNNSVLRSKREDILKEFKTGKANGDFANIIRDPMAIIKGLGLKLAALPKGDIVLIAPKAMKIGDKRQVDVNVGINVPLDTLQKKLKADEQQVKGQAHVSSEMIATLSGPGFKIDAITPEQQAIAEGFPTVWSWNIEAKEPGDQQLEATLYALVPNGDTNLHQRVNSASETIGVSVREKTWGEWLESLSHGIDTVKAIAVTLGGIVTAVLGWFGITLARQRKNAESGSDRKPTP